MVECQILYVYNIKSQYCCYTYLPFYGQIVEVDDKVKCQADVNIDDTSTRQQTQLPQCIYYDIMTRLVNNVFK